MTAIEEDSFGRPTPMTDKRQQAAKVCRHADPRCLDDPCPRGIWQALCKPDQQEGPSND